MLVDNIEIGTNSNGVQFIKIWYSGPNGYDRYQLEKDPKTGGWSGFSNYIDKKNNKRYLKELLNQFADEIEIIN